MKKRIAIFDFDQTLVNYQTADDFISYVYNREKTIIAFFLVMFYPLIRFIKILSGNRHKKYLLKILKGISKERLNSFAFDFYYERIKPNLNRTILNKLETHRKNGDIIIIVSGSYQLYLNYFCEEFKIKYNVSTKIAFNNGICQGKIDGIDCMGVHKLTLLKESINLNDIDLVNSAVYTDHHSDIYLCKLVGNSYIIYFGQDITWTKFLDINLISI